MQALQEALNGLSERAAEQIVEIQRDCTVASRHQSFFDTSPANAQFFGFMPPRTRRVTSST